MMTSAVAFVGSAAQAGTATQSTSCTLSSVVTFNPGLDFSTEHQQTIKVRGKLKACVGGGVVSAAARGKGGGSLSCTSGTATVKLKLLWNTGETSVVSLIVDLGAQSLSGTVASGKFAGETVSASNVSFMILAGDCFVTPVTKAKVKATVAL
jgi:hypothetical protein